MDIRTPEIIDFKNDIFKDINLCRSLSELAEKTKHGLVVSLESDWGNGKTTFTNRWTEYLKARKHHDENNYLAPNEEIEVVYIDVFKKDYLEDPFESIFRAILTVIRKDESCMREKLFNIGKKVSRELAINAFKIIPVVGNILSDIAGCAIDQTVEEFTDEDSDHVAKFKKVLGEAIFDIREKTGMPLIIILDELDRCRPDYAVKTLERIKHLFDNDNIFFLLVINKQQLEDAIKGVYGNNTNAAIYLNKFIDISCFLPNRSMNIEGKVGYILDLLSPGGQSAQICCSNTFLMIKEIMAPKNIREIYKFVQQLSFFGRGMGYPVMSHDCNLIIAVYLKMYNNELFQKIVASESFDLQEISQYMQGIDSASSSATEDYEKYREEMNRVFLVDGSPEKKQNIYRLIRDKCIKIAYLQKN